VKKNTRRFEQDPDLSSPITNHQPRLSYVMRVLFIIPDLLYGGAAKQLTLLAAALSADGFQRRVCVLGQAEPWVEKIRATGVIVDVLGWRWTLDLPAFGRLRHALRAYQADVLHLFGQSALRAVALAGGLRQKRLIVTTPLPPRKPRSRLTWWDRWLLRQAEQVTAFNSAEAESWRQLGLDDDRLAIVPPGVEVLPSPAVSVNSSPSILCIGPLHRHKGFRDAIWVLDIVRAIHPDLQLRFAGSGPDRSALQQFAQDARVADRVHLLGDQSDIAGLLAGAVLVWVPSHAEGGMNAVLEAMAASKPVVASRLPGLAEIVVDGETGFLVPPGDKAALARQTRVLLDDAELRRRMGEAGRRRAAERFAVADMVDRFVALYQRGPE
jgi:glycosyltransferase involved in cell wall biosynthesis